MSIENNSTIEQSRNMPKGDAKSLPKGWVESTLGEVVNLIGGGTPQTTINEYWTGNFINTAFRFSKLDKQTSWLTLA
jgi:hypothetical protein